MAPRARSSHFLRYGLPFCGLMVVGSVGLGYLLQGRKDLEKVKDEEEWGAISVAKGLTRESKIDALPKPRAISLEDELKELKDKININAYENKPLPRDLLGEDAR